MGIDHLSYLIIKWDTKVSNLLKNLISNFYFKIENSAPNDQVLHKLHTVCN